MRRSAHFLRLPRFRRWLTAAQRFSIRYNCAADRLGVHEWAARLLARDHVAFWMREAEAAAPVIPDDGILNDYYAKQ